MPRRTLALALAALSAAAAQTPVISTTSAPYIVEGRPDLTVVIDGSGFAPGMSARWNSTPLVPSTLTARGGRGSLMLVNPDGATSPTWPVPVTPVFPGITHVTPEVVPAGGAFTLAVDGQSFLSRVILNWNNVTLLPATSV